MLSSHPGPDEAIPKGAHMTDLAETLRHRWSPTAWDAQHVLAPADVERLVEAARWSPSAGNSRRGRSSRLVVVTLCTGGWCRCSPRARDGGRRTPRSGCQRLPPLRRRHRLGLLGFRGVRPGPVSGAHDSPSAVHGPREPSVPCVRPRGNSGAPLPSHWIAMTMTAIGRPAEQPPAEGRVRRSLADVWWQPGPGSTA